MSIQNQDSTAKKVGKKVYFWVAILYLLFMTDFLCRVGINAIFPTIQADLNLTDQQVGYKWGRILGIFNTAMPVGSAVGSLVCGALATQMGW